MGESIAGARGLERLRIVPIRVRRRQRCRSVPDWALAAVRAESVQTVRLRSPVRVERILMSALEPAEVSALFERRFAEGDLEGLMALYEDDAVFPTPRGTSTGHDEIRATLKAYLDSGAKLVFGESLVFPAGDLALIHTPWTMQMPDGASPEGATAEVVRRQSDGSWKYVIDNPDGTALLHHE